MNDIEKRIKLIKKIVDENLEFKVLNYSDNKALLLPIRSDLIKPEDKISKQLAQYFTFKIIPDVLLVNLLMKDSDEESLDNLEQGRILLHKKESIQALLSLMDEEEYCYFAIRLMENIGEQYLDEVKDELWKYDAILSHNLLLKFLNLEGKNSKALPLLLDKKRSNMLTSSEEERFTELSLKYKIENEIQKLQEKYALVENEELYKVIASIKEDFEARIKLIENSTKRRYDEVIEQIKEQDFLLTSDRKEGLQKQIELTNERITGVQNSMKTWVAILAIVFGLVSTVSLIFVSLLATGVLPS